MTDTKFQHTAARRRLEVRVIGLAVDDGVSTHSRPKAAGGGGAEAFGAEGVSTHSRPKAAGSAAVKRAWTDYVSTHSRPKAAGLPSWVI